MSRIAALSKPVRRFARRAYDGSCTAVARVHHRAEIAALREAPWGSAADMDRLRLGLLNDTLQRASRQSPFYREVLGSFAPMLQAVDELARVPVTTRGDMRASGLEHAYPGGTLSRRKTWRTSGSSGEPFAFRIDLFYPTRHAAQRAFVYLQAGLAPGSRIVELLPGTGVTRSGFSYSTFNRTIIGYRGEGLGEAVRAARPSLVYGNRSHLLQVADEIEASKQPIHVPLVCSSSETLLPSDADRLSASFGGRVMEVYGSAEGGNLAFRLSTEQSWTILEPRVLIEILDERRQPVAEGDIGEIVVTTLSEPTSPLIRYATGDLARVESGVASGASGLRIASLEGRASDAVVDARGRRIAFWSIASSAFWASHAVASQVRRWRIHQTADRTVNVYLETVSGMVPPAIVVAVTSHFHAVLGPLPVHVAATARVHEGAGKFRAVTSDAHPSR